MAVAEVAAEVAAGTSGMGAGVYPAGAPSSLPLETDCPRLRLVRRGIGGASGKGVSSSDGERLSELPARRSGNGVRASPPPPALDSAALAAWLWLPLPLQLLPPSTTRARRSEPCLR